MPNSQAETLMETGFLPGAKYVPARLCTKNRANATLSQWRHHQLSRQGRHPPAGQPVTGGLVMGCDSTE